MKNNNFKKTFGQFANNQLSVTQLSQIKGGNGSGDGSGIGTPPDDGVVVVDVIIS